MRPILTCLAALWKKELLTLIRDRHGLAALFLMPAIFILVMSLALADAFTGRQNSTLAYAVLDLDGGPAAQALGERLAAVDLLGEAGSLADEAEARRRVEAGDIAFVVVIPPDFSQRIIQSPPSLRLLADPTVPRMVRDGFRQRVEAETTRLQLGAVLERLGKSLMIPELRQLAERSPPVIAVEAVGHSGEHAALPTAAQQNVPAWLIFSMFFVVVPISAVFIGERQHGTLQRLAAQRVSFALILAGKFLPFVLVNQAQAVLMVAIGRWLVPLCGGEALVLPGNAAALIALWLMSCAVSIAAVAWALLVASLARSNEQAIVIGGVSNILMGALGGVMVPRFVMPAAMQPWTRLSPMDWALDGFHQIMLRHGGIGDVLFQGAALLCFALAAIAVAAVVNRRSRP
ncbi:MAG: ABC transporter permease [Azoarcus sp.]|jgi:ABC-2 type transport system permease protein|nr:ABC transporter permease [Azoarcus sp.]